MSRGVMRGGTVKPKVFATVRIPSPGIELLSEACDVTVHEGTEGAGRVELLQSIRDKDGLVCIPGDRIDKEVLDAAPTLKAISTCSVGYEHIDVAEATKKGHLYRLHPGRPDRRDSRPRLCPSRVYGAKNRRGG